MLEVRLHGPLADEFGRVWKIDVKTPSEAVYFISSLKPRFRQAIMELDKMGLVFRVRTKARDFAEDDLSLEIPGQRLDIIPIVRGASAGVRFVAGLVLVAIGATLLFTGYGAAAAPYLISAGVGLMTGSVVQWLTPQPKPAKSGNALQSWTINGPTNTVDQGAPVPVVYGEVLVGGYTISAGVSATSLDSNAGLGGSASIGGVVDAKTYRMPTGATAQLQFLLTAASRGITGPLYKPTYTWSVSGFSGGTFSYVVEGTSLRLTVTAPADLTSVINLIGNVTLSVHNTPTTYIPSETYNTNVNVTARFGQGT